jgi:hypothetical protein
MNRSPARQAYCFRTLVPRIESGFGRGRTSAAADFVRRTEGERWVAVVTDPPSAGPDPS